ncbi:hypothetical protein HDU91_003784 [Kappamyces sp. JEL0680]|nr:hypothetical protein HDU91_003784 [Kappamyces sp. JEL0680]
MEKYCETVGATSAQDARHDMPYDSVRHTIIIPQYKEDLGTMYDTLDVLASHPMALSHYKICLAMEESEREAPEKARTMIEKYHEMFYDITMTLHPSGRSGEIRGKSSNVAWAAREMVQIFTVMDADTCFAADYFASLSFYYAVATPRERGLMYFAPTAVFDRNADKVPMLVRVGDMQWSMAVISNMFPGAPFSPPCSAYSIPVQLAAAVGLWDCDELSIGEDFHMYIKTYFSTHGQVMLKTIYSPASCCNIEGTGLIGGINARITQAKRHMWGSLDLGYTLRRALFGLFAPTFDLPKDQLARIPFSPHSSYDFGRLASQLVPFAYFLFEAHIFVGQTLLLLILSKWIIPAPEGTTYVWSLLAGDAAVHPHVHLAVSVVDFCTQFGTFAFVASIYYYEGYQRWTGVQRWDPSTPGVQPLGIRSKLQSRRAWYGVFEWVLIPFCGIFFLIIPQSQAHVKQLWTAYLDYVVAAKPQHEAASVSAPMEETVSLAVPRIGKDRGREDSGFYAFDGDSDQEYQPGMWKKYSMPGSPSLESVVTVVN